MTTRRNMIKAGAGLAAILATGNAPAYIVKSMLAARNSIGMKSGGAKLPYDAEVDYLESTGTQWIDTLFKANTTTTRLDISLEVTDATSNQGVFGSRNWATGRYDSCNAFIISQNIFRPDWAAGNGDTLNNITISPNTVYEMSITRGTLVINGETRTYSSTASVDQTHEFLLFNFTNGSDSPFSTGLKGRIRYARLYSNNVLVRDFQPVRFTNELGQSEGAIYDRVSGELEPFRNKGTGAFRWGSDASAQNGGGIT